MRWTFLLALVACSSTSDDTPVGLEDDARRAEEIVHEGLQPLRFGA
jgi:hypothetical protein